MRLSPGRAFPPSGRQRDTAPGSEERSRSPDRRDPPARPYRAPSRAVRNATSLRMADVPSASSRSGATSRRPRRRQSPISPRVSTVAAAGTTLQTTGHQRPEGRPAPMISSSLSSRSCRMTAATSTATLWSAVKASSRWRRMRSTASMWRRVFPLTAPARQPAAWPGGRARQRRRSDPLCAQLP